MKETLTTIITCKNEADNIAACIESIRHISDEILIADSGSTDDTLQIVRDLGGCRIIEREYVNAGNFKNWAIPQAQCDWVLIVDSDERITNALQADIRRVVDCDGGYDGYWIYRLNYFLGHPVHHSGWGNDKVLRLFRRDLGSYQEYTDHTEVAVTSNRVGKLRNRMLHYTFTSYDSYLTKLHHYSQQQAERWHRQGVQPKLWHLCANGPLRFLRSYVVQGGFLDGIPGLQISALTGYYSFMKQARLWALWHGQSPVSGLK